MGGVRLVTECERVIAIGLGVEGSMGLRIVIGGGGEWGAVWVQG